MIWQAVTAFLIVVLFAMDVDAIIPLPCNNSASLVGRICCPIPGNLPVPDDGDGRCGNHLGRGSCEAINIDFDPNRADVRMKWPIQYFGYACECKEQYGGVDCGECSYGYNDGTTECKTKTILPRKSLGDMSDTEWKDYLVTLRKIKDTPSRYVVATKTFTNGWRDTLVRPTTYDLLTWIHHFTSKDNEKTRGTAGFLDFAHEGTGFPTWHRLLLLWFEREIQVAIEDHRFRLPYWDWRDPEQREIPFREDRLGKNVDGNVTGDLFGEFGEDWNTVCWEDIEKQPSPVPICDPTESSGRRLRRCPSDTLCKKSNTNWPNDNDVKTAVSIDSYDADPFNRYVIGTNNSFRNYFEGFITETGSGCDLNEDTLCTNESDGSTPVTVSRKLHNTVHIILGLGDLRSELPFEERGVMSCVAASPNDPVFINHHAMVDCVLEEWLQRNKKNLTYPDSNNIREGHRGDDYIVPLMPLFTHKEMFQTADTFGYSCLQLDDDSNDNNDKAIIVGSIAAFIGLIVILVVGVVLCIWKCKSRCGYSRIK